MRHPILVALSLLWLHNGRAWVEPPVRAEPYCLPQAEAALAGVYLDMPEENVIERLGQPASRESSQSDDGGSHQIVVLRYPGLQVDLGQGGRVERLVTSSPAARMPTGVRVGHTVSEVTQRLRAPETLEELEEVTWTPPLCENGPVAMEITPPEVTFFWEPVPGPFDPQRPLLQVRRLSRIEMTHYGR